MTSTYSESYSINNNINSNHKNTDSNKDEDNIDYDDLYKRLMGLVKIQALIRGYLTRKRIIITKIKVVNKSNRND